MDRRTFIGSATATGVTLLAGCGGTTGGGSTGSGDGTMTGSDGTTTGTFRLLVSDRPADIDDFDSLDVTLDRARVFRASAEETETAAATENATAATTENATATATEDADDADEAAETDEADDEDEADDGEAGFTVFDLDSPTVDLTQVVGEKAVGVLEGKLEPGRYSKVELYAASVEGVVDGETVDVKIPSGKLQIVKPFEVVAGETTEFVFDINVVKKGNGGYNLLPVISESGVAGEDVDVEEVGEDREDAETETDDEETESGTATPEDPGNQSQGGNRSEG